MKRREVIHLATIAAVTATSLIGIGVHPRYHLPPGLRDWEGTVMGITNFLIMFSRIAFFLLIAPPVRSTFRRFTNWV